MLSLAQPPCWCWLLLDTRAHVPSLLAQVVLMHPRRKSFRAGQAAKQQLTPAAAALDPPTVLAVVGVAVGPVRAGCCVRQSTHRQVCLLASGGL